MMASYQLSYRDSTRALEEGQLLRIGRAPTNDVVCEDEAASRHHAEVRLQQGQLSVRDLGSTNGTVVNGVKIAPRAWLTLQIGHCIQIGEFEVTVVEAGRPGAASSAPSSQPEPGAESSLPPALRATRERTHDFDF